ncbi:MAG: hypothetical protein WB646_04020, partial [Steroidobacteraceae bacterium]
MENVAAAAAARDLEVPAVLRVALDMPRATLFDYLPPCGVDAAQVPIGARVRVPVGRRERVGIVVAFAAHASVAAASLKPIHALLDEQPLFDAAALQLLRWTAQYYHHPLGEVLAAAIPKALRQGAPALPLCELWRLRPLAADDAPRRAPRQQALLSVLAAHP